jgi:glucose-1-phosphate thymidylyltransferase
VSRTVLKSNRETGCDHRKVYVRRLTGSVQWHARTIFIMVSVETHRKRGEFYEMQAIILAGGFAKRLRPLSDHTPKPLLKVGGRAIIDYVIDRVMEVDYVAPILISVNLRFREQFDTWIQSRRLSKASLIVEGAMREEEKPGAVAALARMTENTHDDCLIVAGDNLFTSSLEPLIERFRSTRCPVMGIYNLEDKELAKHYSTISLDSDGRIIRFVEKPRDPESSLIGTAIYILPHEILPKLQDFARTSADRDSPGRFIEWLYTKQPTYGVVLGGQWWDIGTLDEYTKVNRLIDGTGHLESSHHQTPC